MQYKVVPGPQVVEGTPAQAADFLTNMINENATDGWKYHSMETLVAVETKKGCFNKSVIERKIYMLIFSREN